MIMNVKAVSIAAYLAMVAGILLQLASRSLLGTNPIAVAVQVAAVALMLWARVTFGTRSFHAAANPTEGGLVTSGPYRWLRHPIYAAVLWFVWAGALSNRNASGVASAFVVTAGTLVRILLEESQLKQRYPEYEPYMQRTRRVIPFVF